MENIYKVTVIGAGSIGANKPDNIDGPMTENILTHAHAVSNHPRTELQAIVDTDESQLRKAVEKWHPKKAFHTISELENDPETSDIVIVAVPTNEHCGILLKVANLFDLKLVIAEKPFCFNLKQADTVYYQYDKKQIPIMVNYIRRFNFGHRAIKDQIDLGFFGKALNCRVLYTRGIQHEGGHALDLLRWFFGECTESFIEGNDYPSFDSIIDRSVIDPTIHANFKFEKCPSVVFQPCDGRLYGIFEVDVCFEKCRIRIIDNGLYYEVYPVNEENEWGHKSLSYKLTEVRRYETQLNLAMYHMINNAVNFLDGKEKLFCTTEDAISVHKILEG